MMMLLIGLLMASILIGLVRVVIGPSHVDRLLAIQLSGTTGTAILLILSQTQASPALMDAALILALLAALVSAALVQFLRKHDD
ncbi:multiple resistance and pH regulation protein F [Methylophaga lonarensis MPL]|uniref:Multiple resistance and pH regulation protein F n=1 Tax=Methylophaga lonarensis MPL TaxID=1286106 RepID=M7PIY1_9GAMM|nr:monovalent cation/H+ antiporter complex subunit F [Methylophaga lonarensis]EMR13830.1 multiple resistance and pH regulation protein F [Methylophaga lonarensis MPL]